MVTVVAVVAAMVVVTLTVVFSISYRPVGHLAIYFFNFHRFSGSGGGGGSGVGCGRSIFWDDPLLTDSSILVFIEKA